MPTYDYRCNANGRVLEVSHRMSENCATWGDLCRMSGIEPGDTPTDAPVERLATGGNVVKGVGGLKLEGPACSTGGCCAGGMCGLG